MALQIPDPSLAKELGIVGYLLLMLVVTGTGVSVWFLKRAAEAIDRMVSAHEKVSPALERVEALLEGRLEVMDGKLDEVRELASEHVRIAKMWEQTEAPGRVVTQETKRPNDRTQ